MPKTIQDLIELAKNKPQKRLVVAVANDPYVLKAVEHARQVLNIKPILVGDEIAITHELQALHYDIKAYQIVDEPNGVLACKQAAYMIRQGEGDILMKGLIDTSILLKAVLDKEFGIRGPRRLSHITLLELKHYHKLLLLSDAAMNIAPDVELKKEIILNGVEVLHKIGIEKPNVGVIAAVEKVNPKMVATTDAQALIESHTDVSYQIGGPFGLDNAINKEAALHKGVNDPMAGEVDFLLMPAIEAGNILYKALMFLSDAKSASVVCGATHPIVLTSRADSDETKFNSIALAALL
ncbi:phosphate acyltransferase [Paracholeplasma manati]|uniref:Phosphate acyltransferase n=1 Tax=Paracholeplasma manati TaxID=591373 RepID=A0ABT2Y712_9MOLU|nr:phosphate acyltransferase [Paracholeplasma manati]MCV2232538.1 phosphate acyltransferase [Paracholeplasma manati]MDG0889031.1 phosphate acyltransferase [Paracholeplasma manati]